LRGGDQEDQDSRPAWAKSFQDPSQPWLNRWHVPIIPVMWGSRNKRISGQAGSGIKQDLISKTTNVNETCSCYSRNERRYKRE
jgi:hypothetical protein